MRVNLTTRSLSNGVELIAVEIINLGFIAVTIKEVSFHLRRSRGKNLSIPSSSMNRQSLPFRLEPRTGMTIHVPWQMCGGREFADVDGVRVKTACGLVFKANSRLLKERVNQAALALAGEEQANSAA